MAKSRQSHEMAKAFVSPLFAWSNAVLKGGEMMLDFMQAAAKNVRNVRVAVLPDADAPPRKGPGSGKKRRRGAKARRG